MVSIPPPAAPASATLTQTVTNQAPAATGIPALSADRLPQALRAVRGSCARRPCLRPAGRRPGRAAPAEPCLLADRPRAATPFRARRTMSPSSTQGWNLGWEGPAAVDGSKLTFPARRPAFAFQPNAEYWFALVAFAPGSAPPPQPSASPAASPAPPAAPSPTPTPAADPSPTPTPVGPTPPATPTPGPGCRRPRRLAPGAPSPTPAPPRPSPTPAPPGAPSPTPAPPSAPSPTPAPPVGPTPTPRPPATPSPTPAPPARPHRRRPRPRRPTPSPRRRRTPRHADARRDPVPAAHSHPTRREPGLTPSPAPTPVPTPAPSALVLSSTSPYYDATLTPTLMFTGTGQNATVLVSEANTPARSTRS